MKNTLLLIALFAGLHVKAQTQVQYRTGGFGHFMTGPVYFNPSSLSDYISSPAVLGPDYTFRNLGMIIGGEGAGVRGKGIIGGGGFGMALPANVSDSGSIKAGFGAGYLKVGYIYCQRQQSFAYVYGDIGAGGLSFTVKNKSVSNALAPTETNAVPPGQERKFSLGVAFFDAGTGIKFILPNPDKEATEIGGFTFGIDAGCMASIPVSEWKQDDNDARLPIPNALFMPYARVTIGGAGFKQSIR